jgi:hypothetical protein
MFDRIRAAFWEGYESARAKEQPAPLAPLENMSEEVKAVLGAALRDSFNEGAAATTARFTAFFESDEYKKPLAALVLAAFNDGVRHERERIAAAAFEHTTVARPTESSPLWSGPLGADRDQAADLTVCRAWWSSNCFGLR